ncbi:MAG: septum formation initiator family protein [Proteobacteria bacterium]|nr:septum formation initiator family protein [Pseudomonadota bacterium]
MQINERKILRGLGLIFSISVIAISIFSDKGLLQLKELKQVESSLIIEIEKLKQENLEWKEKVKSLKTNRTYLESLAREELGMIKRDEISIQIVDNDSF